MAGVTSGCTLQWLGFEWKQLYLRYFLVESPQAVSPKPSVKLSDLPASLTTGIMSRTSRCNMLTSNPWPVIVLDRTSQICLALAHVMTSRMSSHVPVGTIWLFVSNQLVSMKLSSIILSCSSQVTVQLLHGLSQFDSTTVCMAIWLAINQRSLWFRRHHAVHGFVLIAGLGLKWWHERLAGRGRSALAVLQLQNIARLA